jgi:hypothetical protein
MNHVPVYPHWLVAAAIICFFLALSVLASGLGLLFMSVSNCPDEDEEDGIEQQAVQQ